MRKQKLSMQALIQKNKEELINNKFEIDKIEKRIDERFNLLNETNRKDTIKTT